MNGVLLKKDISHWKRDTGNDKHKNGAEDIDLHFDSIYKFYELLVTDETGATDLLFSMFHEDTIEFVESSFIEMVKSEYKEFYNSNVDAWIGYAMGQSYKYGVKGTRFQELEDSYKFFSEILKADRLVDMKPLVEDKSRIGAYFEMFDKHFKEKGYKYIRMRFIPDTRQDKEMVTYVEILGRKFNR